MTITPTALLSLPIITTGTEPGTWGDVVDNGLTAYLDIAIAGGLDITITTADVTLTKTAGTNATTGITTLTAQYAILNISGIKTGARNLNLPISSKQYTINNAGTGGFLLTVRGVTPTTGITLVDGEKCIVAWSGTDFVKVASSVITTMTGVLPLANGGTAVTSAPAAMASLTGFTTTATAGATTTLTNASSFYQLFTGANTQDITLPLTSTLAQGWTFHICNNSTGNLSVQSSGSDPLITVLPGTTAMCTCILASGTTATSWEAGLTDFSTATGTGAVVLGTSPTIATATLTGANTIQSLIVGLGGGVVATNTAVGVDALEINTSGAENTAIGYLALTSNISGTGNTVLGHAVMTVNSTGNYNVAIGRSSLAINDGDSNVAIGSPAMNNNTSGALNTAVGYLALNYGSAGNNNTCVGASAGLSTVGSYNTAVGSSSLVSNGSGSYNVALGDSALYLTTGSSNIGLGASAGGSITTGSYNVILGSYSGSAAPISATGSNWVVLSDGAGTVRQAIDSAGNSQFLTGAVVVYAPAPTATISALATLTNAQLQPGIVVTSGTSFTLTMPTGSTLDTLVTWAGVDLGFEFSLINTASSTITMAISTGVTNVGTLTVLTGISARFRIRRTAASTYVVYRIA